MEAVILAGGQGARLQPYTTVLPKPLMPVGGRPILGLLMKQLRRAGVTKVTIAVNYMADTIMALFGNGEKYGLEIAYSLEDRPLGTVAPLKLINHLPDVFIVLNGDILTDLDFNDLCNHHMQSCGDLTISGYQRESKIDFGVLDVDKKNNRLTGFREKPVYHFDVSMGIYVFNRKVLESVPDGQPYGLDNLVLDMLSRNAHINIYPFRGYWLDIGRPDDFEQANREIDALDFGFGKDE